MDPLVIALLTVTALLAGTVDAIAGGGGLITLPALLTAGLPPHVALGTNKGQSVWGSGAALVAFWRAGRVDGRQAGFTFPLGFLGSLAGAQLVLLISKDALRPIVIVLLIGAAVLLVVRKPSGEGDDTEGRPWIAAALALGIGAYDGFFGPGTGTFLIVGFVALCGRSLVRATADAKVVNFASNLAALAAFTHNGSVMWEVALPMAVGQLFGGLIGARLAIKGGARLIRAMVLIVSGALVIKLGYHLIR
ncbi:MAG: Arginine/ornithine antiporter ArcD [Myxococcales bacterium]|nr:Arginine/ornithine antiporter ArcD [Myxococcales bacterium]